MCRSAPSARFFSTSTASLQYSIVPLHHHLRRHKTVKVPITSIVEEEDEVTVEVEKSVAGAGAAASTHMLSTPYICPSACTLYRAHCRCALRVCVLPACSYTEEEVSGWRIDEVEDRKIVEVEEWEIYELTPEKVRACVCVSSVSVCGGVGVGDLRAHTREVIRCTAFGLSVSFPVQCCAVLIPCLCLCL